MKYPTFKVRGFPTPNETLYVCDTCETATWGPAGIIEYCFRCRGRKGGPSRCRQGTIAETNAAKTALEEIIG